MVKKQWMLLILLILFLSPVTAVQADTPAEIYFVLPPDALRIGESATLEVWVHNVSDLYAFDVRFSYDPAIVQVDGIQHGSFLDLGLIPIKTVEDGQVKYAVAQMNPSQAKSGDGLLFTVDLTALATGECDLLFTNQSLSNADGMSISSTIIDTQLFVIAETAVPTETPLPTETPTASPTPINTVQPTNTVLPTNTPTTAVSPTLPPTQTLQATAAATSTPLPSATIVVAQPTANPTSEVSAPESNMPTATATISNQAGDDGAETIGSHEATTTSLPAQSTEAIQENAEELAIPVSGEEQQPPAQQGGMQALAEEEAVPSAFSQISFWAAIFFAGGLTLLFLYGAWANSKQKDHHRGLSK